MRSLRFMLVVCLIAFFCLPFLNVADASPQHPIPPNYSTTTDFVWASIQTNISGSYVDICNVSVNSTIITTPGTDLNLSQLAMYVDSSATQRVDFTFTITDNAVPMYSYAVTNVDTAVGNYTYQFLSGVNQSDNFNFTTVHNHVYVMTWHYRCHTVFWNSLLTQDDLVLTVEEAIPVSDYVSLVTVTAFTFPGGTFPLVATSFPSSPPQATIIFTSGDDLWGINVSTMVGAVENVQLISDITMFDGSNNVSYAQFTYNESSGLTAVYFGVSPGSATVSGSYGLLAGHIYTILVTYALYDGNNTVVSQGQFSLALHEVVPAPFYYNWMLGIIYAVGLFGPAIILGWFVPRYGVMIGVASMSIVIGMLVGAFIPITFISLVVVGVMLFIGRG